MIKINRKKGQEEMVGFVLIIVLVAIIGVIFLSISLRTSGSSVGEESDKIGSLIGALAQVTTKCEIPEAHYQDVGDLIDKCNEGKSCSSCDGLECGSGSACDVLKNTLEGSLKTSYAVGEGSYVRYYNLSIYREIDNSLIIQPIITGNTDGCPGNKLFNGRDFNGVKMSLEVCFNLG